MRRAPGRSTSDPSPVGRAGGARAPVVALAILLCTSWLDATSAGGSAPTASLASSSSSTNSNGCGGFEVPTDADLRQVMASRTPGTTYCLPAGSFEVRSTISIEAGDRVIGAGRDATFIDGSGLAPTSVGIFEIEGDAYFEDLEISGAPTPVGGSGVFCGTETAPFKSNCGKAFAIGGASLTVRSVDCHDNGGNCIGGGGSANVTVDGLDCWNNGNAYSMTSDFRYAACIKRAAIYSTPGNTTVTNSYIHDNPWVGIWCDFCKHGFFDIENNRFVHNGQAGVQWEMSGGWTSTDHAVIRNNVFRQNNYREEDVGAGVIISTANDITVESNVFDGNRRASVNVIFTASRNPPQHRSIGVVIRDNTLNADAIVGCGRISVLHRLESLLPAGFGIGLVTLVLVLALILFGVFFRSRPRLLVYGFAGVILVLVLSVLPLLDGPGAACVNNA
jgi:Right handed beta helix region